MIGPGAPGDIPGSHLMRHPGLMRRRLAPHGLSCSPPVMLLTCASQHAIEGGFRGQIATFVGKPRHNLPRRQAGEAGFVADGQNVPTFLFGQPICRSGACRRWASVRFQFFWRSSAAKRSYRQAEFLACATTSHPCGDGFFDQLNGVLAIGRG